jgi:hypothetical protein
MTAPVLVSVRGPIKRSRWLRRRRLRFVFCFMNANRRKPRDLLQTYRAPTKQPWDLLFLVPNVTWYGGKT